MDRQPSIRPHEQAMPPMPEGTVSRDGVDPLAAASPEALVSPPAGAETLSRGKEYYGYYCRMCHGPDGRGETPVGEAYHPRPADLSAPGVQRLADAQLYRRMLTGVGHDPVLTTTVPRDRRWPIVRHVRTLAADGER
jgi:mono/diheme cytochrome c family protein